MQSRLAGLAVHLLSALQGIAVIAHTLRDPEIVVLETKRLQRWIRALGTESAMLAKLDRARFGPWAVITGASSGIGREFARQIAASGINVVLVARRETLLREAGTEFSEAVQAPAKDLNHSR